MCLMCLDYLNRRKVDPEDPTFDNWPARDWPTLEDLEGLRRRYPEPMFGTREELKAAATDFDTEDEFIQASFVWRMEREEAPA